jgi:hypothetical protein
MNNIVLRICTTENREKSKKKEHEILNILELIMNVPITFDDCGNVYINGDYDTRKYLDMVIPDNYYYDSNSRCEYFITKEEYDSLSKIDINVTLFADYKAAFKELDLSFPRRPYYRMRGRSITRQQAFEIIRRTDRFFDFYIEPIAEHTDYLGCYNFDNWIIQKNHLPQGYGWVHADGNIGANAITQKFPTTMEIIVEWFIKLRHFPFLDFVVAITRCDEHIPDDEGYTFESEVLMGIHVHDNKIEVLDRNEALIRYKEYDEKYGINPEKFEPDYYEKNHIVQVDGQYLRRCIESYGLNADDELSKVPENVIKGML